MFKVEQVELEAGEIAEHSWRNFAQPLRYSCIAKIRKGAQRSAKEHSDEMSPPPSRQLILIFIQLRQMPFSVEYKKIDILVHVHFSDAVYRHCDFT